MSSRRTRRSAAWQRDRIMTQAENIAYVAMVRKTLERSGQRWPDQYRYQQTRRTAMMAPKTDLIQCPRCGDESLHADLGRNALSRTTRGIDDVAVYVCSECGVHEGLQDAFGMGADPQSAWPVSNHG